MKVIPLKKKVLVKVEELPEMSKGGIILPQGAAESDKLYGIVKAIGPEAFKGSAMVKVGDRIVMLKYHGDPIEIDGEKCKLMDDETILAVVK
ncbi:co-chaperone GroES [Candidatus Parcubacteria bacterium]|nr:co-chaperone GroES [Candidatus Parcubacteria bacterium]